MPATATIHIAKSLKSRPLNPKLVKEYVCPNAENKRKIKNENTTMCIVHSYPAG